jgi:membrane fusion protein (multidrug efflux system)
MTDEDNNAPANEENHHESEFDQAQANGKRKRLFTILAFVVVIAVVAFGIYYVLVLSKHITTDDAYVGAEIAQVTPSINGIVKDIKVNDTDAVKAGDVLVVIDDTDARLALARAQANLLKDQVDVERTKLDYSRRQALQKSGSVSAEEVSNAEDAYKAAEAALNATRAQGDQAKVDLDRTIIRSPVDGVIAKRQVELGQRVETGTPLMSVVPVGNLHVDANFKEVQLRKMKIGQPAKLTSDLYGSAVVYHGTVVGLSGGTGAAFSLIPAQNATGNWIKVVQRLPVRINLNPDELAKHPLEVGLSMNVDIDIAEKPDAQKTDQPQTTDAAPVQPSATPASPDEGTLVPSEK